MIKKNGDLRGSPCEKSRGKHPCFLGRVFLVVILGRGRITDLKLGNGRRELWKVVSHFSTGHGTLTPAIIMTTFRCHWKTKSHEIIHWTLHFFEILDRNFLILFFFFLSFLWRIRSHPLGSTSWGRMGKKLWSLLAIFLNHGNPIRHWLAAMWLFFAVVANWCCYFKRWVQMVKQFKAENWQTVMCI